MEAKRRYRSPRRAEQAAATRRAILESGLELFLEQGYATTSIRQIAERANVSEQTVYNVFGDKVGLLLAASREYADLAAGQAETAFVESLKAEGDSLERIRMVARSARETWVSGMIEMDVMVFSAARSDPRLAEIEDEGLVYMRAQARAICEILFPDDIRRPGIDLDDIADFAAAFESGQMLTRLKALGWDMADYEAWLVKLFRSFLDPAQFPPEADA